jgi:hemolysin activation/secretion protein
MAAGRNILALAASLAVAWPGVAPGQQVRLPGSVEPSRIQERLPPQPSAPPVSPPLTIESTSPTQPAGSENLRFRLTGLTLTGNLAFSEADLLPLWADRLGREISLADVYAIAEAITVKYRNAGYILARAVVPPQRIDAGIVRIRVVEGYIDKVRITGAAEGNGLVDAIAAHLTETRPLTAAVLERYLLLLQDLPGAGAQTVLSPSATTPGAATLTIALQPHAVNGFTTLDNRGSRFVGPLQASIGGQVNGIFGHFDATQLQFLTTPYRSDQLRYGAVTHIEPIGSEGTVLSLGGSYAETQPGSGLKPLGIDGRSLIASALLQHPFIRSRSENLYGRLSVDLHNTTTDLAQGTLVLYKDRLRILRLGGTYNIADAWQGTNEATLVFSQGLPILHASRDGGPELSRAAGQSDFSKLNLDLSRLQQIDDNWSVLIAASGQYAFNPLLVAEQYGLGGTLYNRAFDPSEMLGDSALAGKIELRYSDTPGLDYLRSYQLYAYLDAGGVWTLRTPPGQQGFQGAESAGVGARLDFSETFAGGIEGTMPIGRRVAAFAPRGGASPRVFFNVIARF